MSKLTVLSFGGGQDSTAILLKMIHNKAWRAKYAPKELIVIMSDTGDEHHETYSHVGKMQELCASEGIPFIFLKSNLNYHSPKWPSLRDFYRRTNTIGSKAFPKTCTDNLKIKPIYNYLEDYVAMNYGFISGRKRAIKSFAKEYGKINVIVGIAKGEESRVADNSKRPKWMGEALNFVYPLIEEGMDRAACHKAILSHSDYLPLPSNCILCPYMNEVELLWLKRFLPEHYEEWMELENNKLQANKHMGDRNLGVWGKKTLPQVLEKAIEKHGHMTDDELWEYKMSHGHCVKSKY